METDPVSEMSCFYSNYLESGRWTKSENPVILFVIRSSSVSISFSDQMNINRFNASHMFVIMKL
jgi:hypothetical protein